MNLNSEYQKNNWRTDLLYFAEVFTDEDDEVFTAIETKKWRDRELPPDEYAKSTQIKYKWNV